MQIVIVPVTAFKQNCSVVWCSETMKAGVVDPGGDVDQIISVIEDHSVSVEKILITHGHVDHAGGASELAERLDVPIEGPHRDDDFWLRQLPEQTVQFNLPESKSFVPDRWLDEGDIISIGNVSFRVFHCPGHTPGHVIFYEPEGNIAFVGDVLFQGSIGRTDFPRGNHQDLLASITQKLWPLGNDVRFFPGHGVTSTFGDERKNNPFVADNIIAFAS
jgi:glyoxylase-like metal-dependent hydrolase (beta-lactamase superfamily II)